MYKYPLPHPSPPALKPPSSECTTIQPSNYEAINLFANMLALLISLLALWATALALPAGTQPLPPTIAPY